VYLAKIANAVDKDPLTAKRLMEKAIAIEEDDEQVWFELAMMQLQWGELGAAKAAMDTAQLHSNAVNHTMIGTIYLHYNCLSWAAEQFATAIAMSHMWTATTEEASLLLAECRERQGQPDQAATVYKSILVENPHSARALTRLGLLLLGTGLNNYGALRACGINQRRAEELLRTAMTMQMAQNSSDSIVAADALAFCENEHAEVRQWASVLRPPTRRSGTLELSETVLAGPVTVAMSRMLTSVLSAVRAMKAMLVRGVRRILARFHSATGQDGWRAPELAEPSPGGAEETTAPSAAQRMRKVKSSSFTNLCSCKNLPVSVSDICRSGMSGLPL
jgi:Tfp pilus assembly protein PilF